MLSLGTITPGANGLADAQPDLDPPGADRRLSLGNLHGRLNDRCLSSVR